MKHIAFISPHQMRMRRGIERSIWSLSQEFAERHLRVDLLTMDWPDRVDWGQPSAGMRILRVPYLRYYMAYTSIPFYIYHLLMNTYDAVFIFFAGLGEAESINLVRKLKPLRYGAIFQYPRDETPHQYRAFDRHDLARRADWLIAVSQHVARGVEGYFERDCHVIGNGVDVDKFRTTTDTRQEARADLRISHDALLLVTLAALEPRKGVQFVIQALPQLLSWFPTLQYWVLGEGSYRPILEKQIDELGLRSHVRLVGSVPDVIPFLSAADVGCLLSKGEAFPLTALEYMAMSLPIVTSKHPPYSEFVDSSFGMMVDEGDVNAITRALSALLENESKRTSMGKLGREEVLRKYSWASIADEFLTLIVESQKDCD